ncbi:MAG: hypothetical protein ACOX4Z_12240 [Desulfobulbus sp.]
MLKPFFAPCGGRFVYGAVTFWVCACLRSWTMKAVQTKARKGGSEVASTPGAPAPAGGESAGDQVGSLPHRPGEWPR